MGLSTISAWLLPIIFFCLPQFARSQNPGSTASAIPAELTATDPEIRALLNDENTSCKSLNPSEQVERSIDALFSDL